MGSGSGLLAASSVMIIREYTCSGS
jgi:hypothetical protein